MNNTKKFLFLITVFFVFIFSFSSVFASNADITSCLSKVVNKFASCKPTSEEEEYKGGCSYGDYYGALCSCIPETRSITKKCAALDSDSLSLLFSVMGQYNFSPSGHYLYFNSAAEHVINRITAQANDQKT